MVTIDLSGKRAWVTGASRGIGRATALALAEAGCDVAIGYRHADEEAADVERAVSAMGRRAYLAKGHVGSSAECERMHADSVAALGGPIDILVNNAGIHRNALFLTMEDALWDEVIETNLMGTVYPSRTVLRTMWARKQGRIINVSSVAAHRGGRGQANYAASKGAVEALTKSLAVEAATRGITVNCISPGAIDTTMWEGSNTDGVIDRQLIKRMGKPEEIAAWVVMLCSEHAGFVTGQVLSVDGGWQMGWDVKRGTK